MHDAFPSSIFVLIKAFLCCFSIFKDAMKSKTKELRPWIKGITNHFGYCATQSLGYIEFIVDYTFYFTEEAFHIFYEKKQNTFFISFLLYLMLFLVWKSSLCVHCDSKYPFTSVRLQIMKETISKNLQRRERVCTKGLELNQTSYKWKWM